MPDATAPAESSRMQASMKRSVGGGMSAVALAALVAAAVTSQAPRTAAHEGRVYRAYQDQGGVWTICEGHTDGVRAGMIATKAQCDRWGREDLTAHTAAAVRATPQLVEQRSAMEQAGDFALNAGDGWWKRSPMAAAFAQRRWRAGCEAFRGYITLYAAPRTVNGQRCFHRARDNKLFCEANGLVKRREDERRLCLGGLTA